MDESSAFALVREELNNARKGFRPFYSQHEGYAILLEEVDELWHAIKHGTSEQQLDEAIQVAAMAVRFLTDCT